MQAIELETSITNGEIHVRLPADINAATARLIVLYETKPMTATVPDIEVLQFLDGLVGERDWPVRSKEDIDRTLAEERGSWD